MDSQVPASYAAGAADAVAGSALRAGDESRIESQPRLSELAQAVVPPLAVFLVARLFLSVVGTIHGVDSFAPQTWVQWDAVHYLSIARDGHTLHLIQESSPAWVGNCGWFPLFPLLVRATGNLTGMHLDIAAIVLAETFALLTLLVLWNRLLLPFEDHHRWLTILTAGFFPGMVYQHAPFPISLATLLITVHLYLLWRRQWFGAGIAAMLAGMSHPTACALPAVALIWTIYTSSFRGLLAVLIGGLALPAVFLTHYLAVGRWDAYFLVQASFGHRLQLPLMAIWHHVRELGMPRRFRPTAYQELLVTVTLIQCLWNAWRSRSRSEPDRILTIFAPIFWLVPISIYFVTEYRSNAMLLPCVLLTRHVPMRTRGLILVLCIAVAYELSPRVLLGRLM